jgi:hypothetical protein
MVRVPYPRSVSRRCHHRRRTMTIPSRTSSPRPWGEGSGTVSAVRPTGRAPQGLSGTLELAADTVQLGAQRVPLPLGPQRPLLRLVMQV